MMILVILIRFLHTNPAMLIEVLDIAPLTELFLNIDTVSQSIMQIKTVTNFEIIIAAVTIWLARRFFSSIMVSMRKIFNKPFRMQKRRTQVLIFVAEGVLTIIVAILIFHHPGNKHILINSIHKSRDFLFQILIEHLKSNQQLHRVKPQCVI